MPDKRSYVAGWGKVLNYAYNEARSKNKFDPNVEPALELLIRDDMRDLMYEIDGTYKVTPRDETAFLHVLGRRLKMLAHDPEDYDAADDEIDKIFGLMNERDEEYKKREPEVYDLGLVGKDRDEIEKLNCGVRDAFGDFYKKLFSNHTHSAYTFRETDLGLSIDLPSQLQFECVDCGDEFHLSLNHGDFDSYVPLLDPKKGSMINLAYMVWLKDEIKKGEDEIKKIEDGTTYVSPRCKDMQLQTARYGLNNDRRRLEEMKSRESNIRISE
jgi:hypothetical protein